MSPARRSVRRRDWPRGLREPRPGYYAWQHPDGRVLAIGRVPLAVAKAEAVAANLHVADHRPSLVDRLTGAAHTVADLLDKMPSAERPNTAKSWRSLDGIIRRHLGTIAAADLTVRHCAELIEQLAADTPRSAEAVRSRLISVCRRGMALGWMNTCPAEVTTRPAVKVQRGRLSLEAFKAILAVAHQAAEWLPRAMLLAVLTGADRSSIAALTRDDVQGDALVVTRPKTGVRVAIPTAIRLDALGLSLADVLAQRTGVISRHLVHHVSVYGNAPAGSAVHPDTISRQFTAARVLAGIPDDGAPTFHELRSLAKRLYEAQGGVDTKALLGHATERMSDLYANPRGLEPVRVRVA
jgi:integrase